MSNRSAQTLILVLLIMAVSLTVGLGVASRAVSTLRQSSSTAQSTAAYHASEAGIEYFLKTLKDTSDFTQNPDCTDPGNWVDLPGSDSSYCCTVTKVSGVFKASAKQDDVVQVDLSDTPTIDLSSKTINIEWHNSTYDSDNAAISFILFEDRGDGTYNHVKHSFDPVSSRRSINNFSTPNAASGDYDHRATVTTESAGSNRERILRIRPLYAGTHLQVYAGGGTSLPDQQTEVFCEGKTGNIVRRVRVIRGEPALPAVFDYSLFSASETQPLSK